VKKAATALSKFAVAAEAISQDVLPNLQHVASTRKPHVAWSLVSVTHGRINDLKRDGAEVLGLYVVVRDRVKYLIQCTELALDCELMCVDGRGMAEEMAARHCLEAALLDLEKALEAMEPSAEFWQGFFYTGETLSTMAKTARNLRTQLCNHHSSTFPAAYPDFCEALQKFCQEHCAVRDL